ncbi:hypothetical protein [Rubrivivax gelatinosus]|uniref:hypothetical protein n=1 Tax=Rubrivivax gelatinosus TaxID=28068 RepID=UPI001908CA00|nr:hypothetical protein [Rubrivivax gelatinosus]
MTCDNKTRRAAAWLAALGVATLAACGGGENGLDSSTTVTVGTPASIAVESAASYDDNRYGLISAKTLRGWIDNWSANKPAGISGKLVVLQVAAGPSGRQYIKGDDSNVFVYLEGGWTEDRSNGVIKTSTMVLTGAKVDDLLARYAIDPRKDLVVCAQGSGNASNAMTQGRCWYTLRYWGVDARHVAVLNGGNQALGVDDGSTWTSEHFTSAEVSPRLNKRVASVQDLGVDNTVLQATLEDVINVLPLADHNVLDDGVFIWDARSLAQYSAGLRGASVNDIPANDASALAASFQNNGSRQGHPRGALQLGYDQLIDSATGKYKSKADLAALLAGGTTPSGQGFTDGQLALLGNGKAYQKGDVVYTYCETAMRAMITAIASSVVLGLPTRVYDGSMIEWNSLTRTQDRSGNWLIPADSRWRTDVLSWYRLNPTPANVAPRTDASIVPTIVDAYAANAGAAIAADKTYLRAKISSGSGSGSGSGGDSGTPSIPSNPCGG